MSETLLEFFRDTVIGRVALLGGLILFLQIPVLRMYALVGEREESRATAEAEVQKSWGGPQTAAGPVLLVPYRASDSPWINPVQTATNRAYATLRPRELQINGSVSSLVRTRGIFDVLLYRAALDFEAVFARPEPSDLGLTDESILWDEVVVALSGRSVPQTILVGGDEAPLQAGPVDGYVIAPAPRANELRVSYTQDVNGSGTLLFLERATTVELASDWPHPKFIGARLPATHDVRPAGFTAEWNVRAPLRPRLESVGASSNIDERGYGVELIQPVDAYRMTRRAIKYELLFTALTLGVFFLIEVFAGVRIHPVQYLMVGSALVLFYLLILSLSEHITFVAAYSLAALGVVALVSGYARSVLARGSRAALAGATLSMLYGFLFVLLALQDYSLLMGSLGLFLVLASVMWFTRNVDWYALGSD